MEIVCGTVVLAVEDAEDEEFPRDPSPSGADRNFDAVEERNILPGRSWIW